MTAESLLMPLPWRLDQLVTQDGKANDILANNHKLILTVWGGDASARMNAQWLTDEQRYAQAKYIVHACNHFPKLQSAIADFYDFSGMPKAASDMIDKVLRTSYCQEIPPHG